MILGIISWIIVAGAGVAMVIAIIRSLGPEPKSIWLVVHEGQSVRAFKSESKAKRISDYAWRIDLE